MISNQANALLLFSYRIKWNGCRISSSNTLKEMWPHSCHLSWLFQVYRIAMLDYVKNIKWLNSHGMLQSHFICILSINIFLASTDFWFVFQCSSKCFGIDFGSHISTICLYTTLKWSVCMYWAGSVIEINITIQMPSYMYNWTLQTRRRTHWDYKRKTEERPMSSHWAREHHFYLYDPKHTMKISFICKLYL